LFEEEVVLYHLILIPTYALGCFKESHALIYHHFIPRKHMLSADEGDPTKIHEMIPWWTIPSRMGYFLEPSIH
jgi:hypothetical protein